METINTGLNGVPVCESGISVATADADGKPILVYRGYSIYDLVKGLFEETAYLLLNGELPNSEQLKSFDKTLKENRHLDKRVVEHLKTYPINVNRMDFLFTALSFARMYDEDYNNPLWQNSKADAMAFSRLIKTTGVRIGAKIPTIIAYGHRILNGKEPIPPDNNLSCAANFLHMMGIDADGTASKALDTTLTLYLDHTMNNSTFISRVAASARPDPYGPFIAAGVGLKGVLHGGANEMASHMFDGIKSAAKVEHYVLERMERGDVVFGFGHRLSAYKTGVESRVIISEGIARELAAAKKAAELMNIYDKLKQTMMSEKVEERKRRTPNLDLPVAVIYKVLGIPVEWNTPIFQASRHFGWVAHMAEQ
ncbi:MAG: citrate/2-methylcitrate synthase [Deltaproteobacteria bacterium]|nr:citrate/2-methylcitrate synthase [Deltaproteobacteria bacterium]